MKFSIIIPVYNAEKYLKECVDSILKQTYQHYEVILVNDESTDSSAFICDGYVEQDKRVKVIHKKNGGTADSRNVGLDNATGDYIMFMDNDDYWKSVDVLEKIEVKLKESRADVLMFDTMEYWQNKDEFSMSSKKCERKEVVNQPKEIALKAIIGNGLLYRAVWAKVVKADLIRENHLYFEKGIRNEDTDWTAKMLLCAKSYDWHEDVFYVYRKGTGIAQTSKRVSYKEVKDLKDICEKYIDIAENLKSDMFQKIFCSYLSYPYSVLMGQVKLLSKTDRVKIGERDIKKNSYILKYDLDPSVKMVKKVYNVLGYNLTAFLLKLYLLRNN
ncbi:glycosyltransferase [Agathobacter sp.]|uniref:glycosyltransferase n=1 Tax=Agathobacter sp. TaxID=2021311 RepID=UPI003FD7AF8A